MDHFEGIIKTILEHEGYWVRQSFKVNVTKQEKRDIGKPTIPRPEIDILAFNQKDNTVLALEAKSYMDSPGVRISDLQQNYQIPKGRYKLFTCSNYRAIVFKRLKQDLIKQSMANRKTKIMLGLVAAKIYQSRSNKLRNLFESKHWFFWSPEDVRNKLNLLAKKSYENEPSIMTAKLLMR